MVPGRHWVVHDVAAIVAEPLPLAGRAEGLTGSAENVEMDTGHLALGVVTQGDISIERVFAEFRVSAGP